MERLIITIAVISGLVLLTLITLIRYQSNIDGTTEKRASNPIGVYSVYNGNPSDTFLITGEDLPNEIQKVIALDSLINELTITGVRKFSKSNNEYYDVSFLDTDDFQIIVMYDKNGEVISQ